MNEAHVFQHKYTFVQIFVYYCISETTAKAEFLNIVVNHMDWIYLGRKLATNVN